MAESATSSSDGIESLATTLLPHLIDQIARDEPQAIYAEYPILSTTYDAGFKPIRYAELASAINGVAAWVERELGRGQNFETLAYVGPNDARYVFAFVAAIKTGYKLFLISSRNSVAAHLNLFHALDCRKIITTNPPSPSIQEVLVERAMSVVYMDGLEELLSADFPHYPFTENFWASQNDPVFASHTSGSTGLPKPRIYTHEFLSRAVRNTLLPPPKGYQSLQEMMRNSRQIMLLPLSHPAGVQMGILNAIYNRVTIVFPLGSTPPSIEGLIGILRNTKADFAMMAPYTLEALAKNMEVLDEVASHLKMLVFGGGSLPEPLGDTIAGKVKLASSLGSSETAGYPTIFPAGFDHMRDWKYAQIHPAAGVEFEPRANDGFELVVKRSIVAEPYQPVFELFPELQEYKTNAIFTPHSDLPDMWTHASRSDDTIVFLSGEKTNPITFESWVNRHPDVSAAIVFGNQRFEAGILIELKEKKQFSVTERARWIENLWPIIEEANRDTPAHARISKSHICFTDPEQPVLRTGKDTIQRYATLNQYSERIDRLYADVEATWAVNMAWAIQYVDRSDHVSLAEIIQTSLMSITKLKDMDPDEDFFAAGVDSLQVLRLVRELRSTWGIDGVQPTTVYLHPSAASLTKAIHGLINNNRQSKEEQEQIRKARILEILQQNIRRVDQVTEKIFDLRKVQVNVTRSQVGNQQKVVILTGSTGSIGSYILRALLDRPDISRIYCLNRSAESETKQKVRNAAVDPTLPTVFAANRVKFLEVDLSHSTFGLTPQEFRNLSKAVSLIIHNAWPVNFNLPLQSFSKHLDGVVNLCAFCAACDRSPTFLFLSSVSAVMSTALASSRVPETIQDDPSSPAPAGYAESKYIAERLLTHVAEKSNMDIRIARLGQVSGAVRSPGKWNPVEWIPSLILGSRRIGVVPNALGLYGSMAEDIDWIPVDVLADVLIELSLANMPKTDPVGTSQVFQVMNPCRTSWSSLLPSVIETLNASQESADASLLANGSIRAVHPSEWLEKLRYSGSAVNRSNVTGIGLTNNPALKLMLFYQSKLSETKLPIWETGKTQAMSETLRMTGAITRKDMGRWVRSWCEGS